MRNSPTAIRPPLYSVFGQQYNFDCRGGKFTHSSQGSYLHPTYIYIKNG